MTLTPVDRAILAVLAPTPITFVTLAKQCPWISRRALRTRLLTLLDSEYIRVSEQGISQGAQ